MIWNDDTEKTTGISREKYGRLNITYVDIVRCKNCKHCDTDTLEHCWCMILAKSREPDWFCADGERRTEMPDREKVIKAWEIFRDSNPYEICKGREFRAIKEPEYCMGQMIEDTIALLKGQKTANIYKCPNCGTWVSAENVVRCRGCKHYNIIGCSEGFGWCERYKSGHTDDWFCADGERR